MTFTEALSAVFDDGDRVTRAKWNNRGTYLLMESHKLHIVGGISLTTGKPDNDGLPHPYTLDEEDYFADDWEVVE